MNISYQNPLNTSQWIPLTSNYPTSPQGLNYTFNGPDLLQNNPAGDNIPVSDNLVFRVVDNSNNRSYTTAVPYTEYRRGLTQVANDTAVRGLYGNNTDLSTSAFLEGDGSLTVAGEWFNPGTVSMMWDGTTSLGTATADANGFFNATLQVPTTAAGPHNLTVADANSAFLVNVTRLPQLANNYMAGWHIEPFTVNLTSDYGGVQIYYQINGGTNESSQPTVSQQ